MLDAFGLTDTGCERQLNEDRIVLDKEHNIFTVADGMGGQRGGDRAAEITVQIVEKYFQTNAGQTDITWPFGYDATIPLEQNLMMTAINGATTLLPSTLLRSRFRKRLASGNY